MFIFFNFYLCKKKQLFCRDIVNLTIQTLLEQMSFEGIVNTSMGIDKGSNHLRGWQELIKVEFAILI